jgi:hypothetical protein
MGRYLVVWILDFFSFLRFFYTDPKIIEDCIFEPKQNVQLFSALNVVHFPSIKFVLIPSIGCFI